MMVVAVIALIGVAISTIALFVIAMEKPGTDGSTALLIWVCCALIFVASVALMPDKEYPPVFEIQPIFQCRQSPEWCQIQEPELYEAMYGESA